MDRHGLAKRLQSDFAKAVRTHAEPVRIQTANAMPMVLLLASRHPPTVRKYGVCLAFTMDPPLVTTLATSNTLLAMAIAPPGYSQFSPARDAKPVGRDRCRASNCDQMGRIISRIHVSRIATILGSTNVPMHRTAPRQPYDYLRRRSDF